MVKLNYKRKAQYLLEKVSLKTIIVYLDLDRRRGEERKVGLTKFVWIFQKMEGELWVEW